MLNTRIRRLVLVTWREVAGVQPTMADLHQRLAPYRLTNVLLCLARLSALLQTWKNLPEFTTDRNLAQQYLPNYYSRIKPPYDTNPHPGI